jgi:hypothetical protein
MKGARWICFHSSAVKSVFVAITTSLLFDSVFLTRLSYSRRDTKLRIHQRSEVLRNLRVIIGRNNSRVIFFFPAKHHACAASYIIAGQQPLTATQGQDVGIVCADIIALRKIEVESTDYALREYAATREQIEALERERRTKDAANSGGHENSLG